MNNQMHNHMKGDFCDCLITYIESDMLDSVKKNKIL